MGTADQKEDQEPILSEAELVSRFGGLYADRLLHRKLWEFTDMSDEQYARMIKTEEEMYALTILTLPRIHSGEIQKIAILSSQTETTFDLSILNGRIKINLETSVIEAVFPAIRDMIPA